ncbi:MAG: hypothetical protein WBX15_00530 [Thermoanaerobaculia bacterium]
MKTHVTIVGIIHIALGVLALLAGIFFVVVIAGGGLLSGDRDAMAVTTGCALAIGIVALILSLPSIIGGIGLLNYAPWARILVLILGVLDLFNLPVGTAIGIYTMWVLLNDETEALFRNRGVLPATATAPAAPPATQPPTPPALPPYEPPGPAE